MKISTFSLDTTLNDSAKNCKLYLKNGETPAGEAKDLGSPPGSGVLLSSSSRTAGRAPCLRLRLQQAWWRTSSGDVQGSPSRLGKARLPRLGASLHPGQGRRVQCASAKPGSVGRVVCGRNDQRTAHPRSHRLRACSSTPRPLEGPGPRGRGFFVLKTEIRYRI